MEFISTIVAVTTNVITLTILVYKFIASSRKLAKSKTAEEKAAAKNELRELMNSLMVNAEHFYSDYQIMKSAGSKGLGPLKKDQVLTKMNQYCLNRGLEFDSEFWSKQIDDQVEFSKEIVKNA